MSLGDCKNEAVYDELNRLIFEFLELNGLEKTLETFSSECQSKCIPCPLVSDDPERKAAFSNYEAAKMMKAFDDGELEGFLKLWKVFQSHIQVTSDDMNKLEVYIRVHFALYPRAHGQPEEAQHRAMQHLKQFFEQQKSGLGKDSAILPLYALPFVDDPFNHPIFKELFRDLWTMKLRNQLESTVQKYFELLQENICQHSRLAELIVKGERFEDSDGRVGQTSELLRRNNQDRFYQLLSNHRKIRKLLQGTRESYAKLLLVTHELVTTVEQSIAGDQVPMESVIEKCHYIFPELFTPKEGSPEAEIEAGKPSVEYFKRISADANFDPTQDSEVSLFFLGISEISPEFLDFAKIKETLVNENLASVTDKLCLLQSLRWLLTKTGDKSRQMAIDVFISSDLLGLHSQETEYRQRLFHCMLYPTPTYQKECLARLINALSSTRLGRNYLSSTNFIVDTFVKSLTTFTGPTESYICQMVVATLQKLSLKKSMRLFMIQHQVINWLSMFIKTELASRKESASQDSSSGKSHVNFNPYLMEYAWALLMNLCLHWGDSDQEEAWRSCVANGTDILTSACAMLIHEPRKDLAPYVVSTLYSLLRSPDIYALAKQLQIETMLAPILNSETEIAEHLNHLISLLYMNGCDRITSSRETNYDDEDNPDPDVFEPEIELPESWTTSLEDSDLTGDDLLVRRYLMEKVEPVLPTPPSNAEPEKTGVIMRPVTPSKKPTMVMSKPCRSRKMTAKGLAPLNEDCPSKKGYKPKIVNTNTINTMRKKSTPNVQRAESSTSSLNTLIPAKYADAKSSKFLSPYKALAVSSKPSTGSTVLPTPSGTKKKTPSAKAKEDLADIDGNSMYAKLLGFTTGRGKANKRGEGEMDPGFPIRF